MKRIITIYAPREPGGGTWATDRDAELGPEQTWFKEPDVLIRLEVDLETRTTTILKNRYTGEGADHGV